MPLSKPLLLAALIIAIIGGIYYLESIKPSRRSNSPIITVPAAAPGAPATAAALPIAPAPVPPAADKQPKPPAPESKPQAAPVQPAQSDKASRFPRAPELISPNGFINTAPLKLADLIGKKIIMVDFWTYSCINCQRTIPYLNAWYDKYKNQGFEIVGVHTPEFDFEKKYDNVLAAVKKFGIAYPVALDNDYRTWDNYQNRYWPHKFLIDIDGYVVYHHIGEGGYEATEAKIQELLEEKMARSGAPEDLTGYVNPAGAAETAAGSPETYFGAARNEYLANGTRLQTGEQTLDFPTDVNLNQLYLVGKWDFSPEYAANKNAATIMYRYRAKGVYLVGSGETDIRVEVRRDGMPLPSKLAGEDIILDNGKSYVIIKAERLYRLVQDQEAGEHQLELIIESPGLKAYAFTFG